MYGTPHNPEKQANLILFKRAMTAMGKIHSYPDLIYRIPIHEKFFTACILQKNRTA
jgi:hypothetical protein